MRVAELSRRSGVSVASIKYYLREGLLPPGELTSPNQAHYGEAKGGAPVRCGQFPANAWGLHDMHGNVREWTADSYDETYYANSPPEDPPGPESRRTLYAARGGGYEDQANGCRSARRQAVKEETAAADLGLDFFTATDFGMADSWLL